MVSQTLHRDPPGPPAQGPNSGLVAWREIVGRHAPESAGDLTSQWCLPFIGVPRTAKG